MGDVSNAPFFKGRYRIGQWMDGETDRQTDRQTEKIWLWQAQVEMESELRALMNLAVARFGGIGAAVKSCIV
jgi:hypothetical protein